VSRIREELVSQPCSFQHYKVFLLHAGTNDIGQSSPHDICQKIRELCETILTFSHDNHIITTDR
jgi:hypothetical protein